MGVKLPKTMQFWFDSWLAKRWIKAQPPKFRLGHKLEGLRAKIPRLSKGAGATLIERENKIVWEWDGLPLLYFDIQLGSEMYRVTLGHFDAQDDWTVKGHLIHAVKELMRRRAQSQS